MADEKCFAWLENVHHCCATINSCDGYDDRCPFYKTEAGQKASEARAARRLAELSPLRQKVIADTYYHGIHIWDLKVVQEQ